jgi:hypothetical protein
MRQPVIRVCSDQEAKWTSASSGRIRYQSRLRSQGLRFMASWRLRFTIATTLLLVPQLVYAQENNSTAAATSPTRPAILPNRWEEDWSILADPRVPREPFDNLKYISLSPSDPKTYLSLGASKPMTLRTSASAPTATMTTLSAAQSGTLIFTSPTSSRSSHSSRATLRPGKRCLRQQIKMCSMLSRRL